MLFVSSAGASSEKFFARRAFGVMYTENLKKYMLLNLLIYLKHNIENARIWLALVWKLHSVLL